MKTNRRSFFKLLSMASAVAAVAPELKPEELGDRVETITINNQSGEIATRVKFRIVIQTWIEDYRRKKK